MVRRGFLIFAKGFPFEFPIVDDGGGEPRRGETVGKGKRKEGF